ncbi:hypothetical protein AK812_SmicGene48172 [Symbiodinium microadriaticum]|uniref:Uncharacterized protein n=1 Tax=Symbiodinium microadriaticum TaxID=2951 RepID=A0A1Q9BQ89_SYMMI|nr:hypothetical protein AK812_SmicGene48172 [Symbiodinium microadriaticum]
MPEYNAGFLDPALHLTILRFIKQNPGDNLISDTSQRRPARHRDAFLEAFASSYEQNGGPSLDRDRLT